ncbi:MAG TPA: GspH/FimT family pseudopilin [Thermoanaerobaculia bacterium]
MIVATAIFASVFVFTLGYLHTIIRRERMKTAVREIYSLVLLSRMQAVRRDANVVLQVDLAKRELKAWAETSAANFVLDGSEKVLSTQSLPALISIRSVAGPVDGPDGIAFDEYRGNPALVDRVVFGSNGGLVMPQAANSRPPGRPGRITGDVPSTSVNCPEAGCRGIYLADRATGGPNRNLFRISVDDFGRVGKASLLKWLPPEQGGNSGERDFVPPPWKWVD